MEHIIDRIIEIMKRNNSLNNDEEIVRQGLEIILLKFLFLFVIMLIGILTSCFFESIIMTISFSLLRKYAGGYHAKTRKKCFALSILMLCISLSVIKLIKVFQISSFFIICIGVISVIYISIYAPIDTVNKRLDEDEIRVYGKKTKIFAIIFLATAVILWAIRLSSFSSSIVIGITMSAYLMLKEQISNYINNK